MDMASGQEDMGGLEKLAPQEDSDPMTSGSMECNQHCFQCPALTPRQTASAHVLPTNQARAFETFIPPSHLDGLFRPPQVA